IAQEEWMKAVIEYRKASSSHPNDVEFRSRLKQTELKAADYYYQRGLRLVEQNNIDGAIIQFQHGMAAMPEHSKLLHAMSDALGRKEATALYQEGVSFRDAGKTEDARRQFEKALDVYPDYKEAKRELAALRKREEEKLSEGLALTSKAPVTLNFRQTDLKQAFEFIAKSFGINVIFDETVKSVPVTLFAKDVTFEQGLNLLLTTTKTFYKRIGTNTVLIAPDSKEKRGQYEDHLVRTFQLNTVRAKDMADILKGLVTIKKITINETLNTIAIRDTDDIIKVIERIIETNDRKPAEILLDVEILEVNRNKAEKLGLDLGTYSFTAALPTPGTVPISGSIRRAIESTATLSIPSVTFRFFKQDVDAKTLANPKVRVVNNKSAKIHIGDRVPLRASTIVDATGQTRTTFDYKDIGIRLTVEPIVHLDNSATVKLGLEVSSLGENLGTTNEPAFRIGTRNAETFMLLRDGETAILGGLIRDEERNTRVKVPGLGDIPLIGSLFTSYDDSTNRTDVLLTITPRVVRGWDMPTRVAKEFYSGTENTYSDKPLFANLETPAGAEIRTATSAATVAAGSPAPTSANQPATPTAPSVAAIPPTAPPPVNIVAIPVPTAPSSTPAILMFSEPVYEFATGQDFEIKLVGSNLAGASSIPIEILYNPQLLSYVGGTKGEVATESFNISADAAKGVINVSLALPPNANANGNLILANVKLRGTKSGVSYLVYRTPSIKTVAGEPLGAQVRASRVVLK
ncbi:MAG TPA: secretin N-terminal domain-containing protein, partial [Burkholderiales bacterium]|nr:secretin N-terminal domain-containing protein [Burkholderiales bacterium]